jgi:predicted lipid-binding transport protein (Tim44 family)
MRRPATLLAAIAVVALALAPALAEAQRGGARSMGSRGSQTYSAPPPTRTAPAQNQARPMERSMTEPGRAAQPGAPAARTPAGAAAPAAGGMFGRSPFMAGLMGGLIGVGLGGLLFGHGFFGGLSGFAGVLGLLLQIALIAGLVWLVLRLIRGRQQQPALAGAPAGAMARDLHGPAGSASAGARPASGRGTVPATGLAPLTLQPTDFETFERILKEVNEAWSRQDLPALQRLATPEMVQYFSEDLADLASRGLRNETRDTVLEQGDLAEAWREGGREYATVAMRYSFVEVTRRAEDGTVVEGDLARRTEATEIWTFVRAPGGNWLLSAIQATG